MRRAALLVASAAAAAGAAPSAAAPPLNVVFIVADDLGFNELGYQNGTRGLETPNIDALRSTGVALRNYYTHPLCSPSRGALMTGMYAHRLGLQASVIYWDTPWAPNASIPFLPERLSALGWDTAMFGKWHLVRRKRGPRVRGSPFLFKRALKGPGAPVPARTHALFKPE